ncbi:hypothetical protein L3X38_025214 [Prunus dulcis]|uniref:Uncharacterized protein n=1 Tax=Prunus dulcis TaxID=3755 RepID=A0AAD4W226_PRUDU|nr:hypothetical protein L3X38_025214 [Prunus dulcis]
MSVWSAISTTLCTFPRFGTWIRKLEILGNGGTWGFLNRDWIHQSLCIPSTLHQQLALWNEEGHMEIVEADPLPFLPSAMCLEARYYHDDLGPFTFFGVNQNGSPHGVTAQRLIEEGLANSLEDWNRPICAKIPEL